MRQFDTVYEKPILLAAGILFYLLVIGFLRTNLQSTVTDFSFTRQDFVYPYLFAAGFAFLAGLLFARDGLPSAKENLLEVAASFPILLFRFKYSESPST